MVSRQIVGVFKSCNQRFNSRGITDLAQGASGILACAGVRGLENLNERFHCESAYGGQCLDGSF
jgi:hypothetical protein